MNSSLWVYEANYTGCCTFYGKKNIANKCKTIMAQISTITYYYKLINKVISDKYSGIKDILSE